MTAQSTLLKSGDYVMNIQFLIGPVIGLIIGYVTNNIAIKMLFRPLKPVYIGKRRLPFTPGLIPKEKERIAKTIGGVVSTELLDNDTINKTLLSDGIISGITGLVEKLFNKMKLSDNTVREELYQKLDKDLVDNMTGQAEEDIAALIHNKLSKFNFGTEISKKVIVNIRNQYIEKGKIKAAFAKLVDDNMINSLAEPIGKTIDKMVSENSEAIVGDLIKNETDRIMDTKTSEIAERYWHSIPKIKSAVQSVYIRTVKNDLPKVMEKLNIAKIVEDKINGYNIKEFEDLLFSIMKKELNAIIWLGALLGFVMGFLNAFISIIFS